MPSGGELARAIFTRELSWIQSEEIRDLVVNTLEVLSPDSHYFWYRGASKSTKYHPPICNGEHGLISHTKLVAALCRENCRSMDSEGMNPFGNLDHTPHMDECIAAAILHDVQKDGDPELAHQPERKGKAGCRLIGGCHGVDMANAMIRRVFGGSAPLDKPHMCRILRAIAGHMGVWTKPEKFRPATIKNPETKLVADIVHLSDYTASRRIDTMYDEIAEVPALVSSLVHGSLSS